MDSNWTHGGEQASTKGLKNATIVVVTKQKYMLNLKQLRIPLFSALCVLSIGLGGATFSQNQPVTQEGRIEIHQFSQNSGSKTQSASTTDYSLHIPAGELSATFESDQLSPLAGGFHMAGLRWEGELPSETTIQFWLQTPQGGWIKTGMIAGEAKDASERNHFITQPVVLEGYSTRFKVEIARPSIDTHSPHVESVELIAVRGAEPSLLQNLTAQIKRFTSQETVRIISRAEWGADESYRFTSDGTEIWTPTYVPPEKFIIHHTAGGTGGDNPTATLQAVYYWHAQVLGWGDIGYNYIIDPAGNIYEGRFGGQGVVGGHAYNDVTETNFNEGSIGIVLLGCYEADDDGACSSIAPITPEMETALARLIGTQGRALGIEPGAEPSLFHNVSIANIVGHQDVDYTLCPGSEVEEDLERVRNLAQVEYEALKPEFRGKFITSDMPKEVAAKTTFSVTTTWKNTGSQAWQPGDVKLKVYNGKGEGTTLQTNTWTDVYGKFIQNETVVEPGEKATFTIPFATQNETRTRNIKLKLFHHTRRIDLQLNSLSTYSIQPLAVRNMSTLYPAAVIKQWRPSMVVTALNIGSEILPTGSELVLDSTVVATLGRAAEHNETATWIFSWTPPQTIGTHTLQWSVRVNNETIPGSEFESSVRVDRK